MTTTPDRTHPADPTSAPPASDRSRDPSPSVASLQPWQAHRFADILNAGDVRAFDALLAPDYVNHNAFAPPGPDGVKAIFGAFLAAFTDFRVTVEDALASGDRVVGRYTYTGVHTASFLGYAPTGRPVAMRSVDVWRVGAGGRLVEHWDELNTLDFFQQLGAALVPPPAPPSAGAGGRADA